MTTRLRIVFAGTPDFAVPALDALHAAGHEIVAVYTQPDRPAGRGRDARHRARQAPRAGTRASRRAAGDASVARRPVGDLRRVRADLMVVVAYGLILPPAVLDLPRLGCLNIHASLLPRWRGAAPIQRAILAGDTRTGVTIMQMDAGLDTGPMLLVRETPIGPEESAAALHDRLATLGARGDRRRRSQGWAEGRLRAVAAADGRRDLRREDPQGRSPDRLVESRRRDRAASARLQPMARRGDALARPATAHLGGGAVAGGPCRRSRAPPSCAGPSDRGRARPARRGRGRRVASRCAALQLAGRNADVRGEFLNANPLAGARLG